MRPEDFRVASVLATIERASDASGEKWTFQNDALRMQLELRGGSLQVTSLANARSGRELLGKPNDLPLFRYETDRGGARADDGGWTLEAQAVDDVTVFDARWGTALELTVARREPFAFGLRLRFELYDDGGLRIATFVRNDDEAASLTIIRADVLTLDLPDEPHTLHHCPEMVWRDTREPLAGLRNAVTVYDAGGGWALSPELNWRTYGSSVDPAMAVPFGHLDAWSTGAGVRFATYPEALQLVLLPREEFEYLSINLTLFEGDEMDGRMSVEQHLRNRFSYTVNTMRMCSNDWLTYTDGGRTDVFIRDTVVPAAIEAGFDEIHFDDLWNTTRDTTVPNFTDDLPSLAKYITDLGLGVGYWFSLTGADHFEGRDLADPAQTAFKRTEIEQTMIGRYRSSWQQIDLAHFFPEQTATAYSHQSDSAYRKLMRTRQMLSSIAKAHPGYRVTVTNEVDQGTVDTSGGRQSNGMLHLVENGHVPAMGEYLELGVRDVKSDIDLHLAYFGFLPMGATFLPDENGIIRTSEFLYRALLAKDFSIYTAVDNWGDLSLYRVFNQWRKSPRIASVLEQYVRPLTLTAPYAWMHTTPDRSVALLICSGGEKSEVAERVELGLRWLDASVSYLVADITLRDDGDFSYAFRGSFYGEALRSGFAVEFDDSMSKGKAFWLVRDEHAPLQVVYADHHVDSIRIEETGTGGCSVRLTGRPATTVAVLLARRSADDLTGEVVRIELDAAGRGDFTG